MLLVVNADDFGLTRATSETILRCHEHGIVTSTSALVIASGWRASAPLLAGSGIGVGLHLGLVGEDPPLLSGTEIPTLIDERGHLPISWRQFAARAAARRIDPADVEAELGAQLDALLDTGVPLTHIDAHQHLHEWPGMWPIVARLAERAGVRAVRTTVSVGGSAVTRVLGVLGRRTARAAHGAGLVTTDVFAGLEESGHLTRSRLADTIDRLARTGARTAEIGCHPGAQEDPDRTRYTWGFEWGAEASGLCDPVVRARVEQLGLRLGTWGDVVALAGRAGA